MKIFLAGAVSTANDNQLNNYHCYKKVLLDCFEKAELIVPDDISQYRNRCLKQHSNYSKIEIDKMMFDFDIEQVRQSDIIVCDLSALSTGMGIELGVAFERNIKVIFYYEEQSYISNMITGAFPNSTFIEYKNLDDLTTKLTEVLLKKE